MYNDIESSRSREEYNLIRESILDNPFYAEWKMLQGKKGKVRAYLKYETGYGNSLIRFYKRVKHLVKK